ncbi:MAG: hypothetical protein Q8R02_11545 [Hyphomonadaceae bacterium]|nr:hypothetical protein [Hyphomonadaceae bacterium]
MYVRFVLPTKTAPAGRREGIFRAAYALKNNPELGGEELDRLAAALTWLDANLPEPPRFNRTKSKGAYRRETVGLSWFKDTAHETIAHVRTVIRILEARGQPVSMITTVRPGYVVYEDDYQVVAEPFADAEC